MNLSSSVSLLEVAGNTGIFKHNRLKEFGFKEKDALVNFLFHWTLENVVLRFPVVRTPFLPLAF